MRAPSGGGQHIYMFKGLAVDPTTPDLSDSGLCMPQTLHAVALSASHGGSSWSAHLAIKVISLPPSPPSAECRHG